MVFGTIAALEQKCLPTDFLLCSIDRSEYKGSGR
jgi:hypothetical protein